MSKTKIKKCVCGANKFKVEVNVKYNASISPDGRLCLFQPEPEEINQFKCLNCGATHSVDSVWGVNVHKHEEKLTTHAQERQEERKVPSWVMEYLINYCDSKTMKANDGSIREVILLRPEDIKIAPKEIRASLSPYVGLKIVRIKGSGDILTVFKDESPLVR